MMNEEKDYATVEWSEMIVLFNTLLRSIDAIRVQLDDDELGDDEQYNLEEELNDYTMLLQRLKIRYAGIASKGELSASMKKRLQEFH